MSNPTSIEAYPLHWPVGRPRSKSRQRADFHRKQSETQRRTDGSTYVRTQKTKLTIGDSRDRLLQELRMLGGGRIVISSNLRLRQDGWPMSGQREPDDPGVAVYFDLKGKPHCVSCDKWDRAADNLAAIAKHVDAMRGQLRWGVADVESMFRGFKALPDAIITPAAMSLEEAVAFMAAAAGVTTGTIRDPNAYVDCYRAVAKRFHPDANGGRERIKRIESERSK